MPRTKKNSRVGFICETRVDVEFVPCDNRRHQ
jgi:hypothetical protein